MMKPIKYMVGIVALVAFFIAIDPSGVGFKGHMEKIKNWARGESKHLRFGT